MEVLSQAHLPTLYTLLMRAQVRWAGHVVRIYGECIPKQLLYAELTHRGQKKRFKDSLKVSLKSFDIDTELWVGFKVTSKEIGSNSSRSPYSVGSFLYIPCSEFVYEGSRTILVFPSFETFTELCHQIEFLSY